MGGELRWRNALLSITKFNPKFRALQILDGSLVQIGEIRAESKTFTEFCLNACTFVPYLLSHVMFV
jgi:hypothetical protein